MRGLLMVGFTDWVTSTRGLEVTDAIIADTTEGLSTDGAYTTVGDYPHSELTFLAEALARREGVDSGVILREFGRAAYPALAASHADAVNLPTDLRSLLHAIESIIHVDVRKLYPAAQPPLITVVHDSVESIGIDYQSHRNFVPLCQGLIEGAADTFGEKVCVEVDGILQDPSAPRVEAKIMVWMNPGDADHG